MVRKAGAVGRRLGEGRVRDVQHSLEGVRQNFEARVRNGDARNRQFGATMAAHAGEPEDAVLVCPGRRRLRDRAERRSAEVRGAKGVGLEQLDVGGRIVVGKRANLVDPNGCPRDGATFQVQETPLNGQIVGRQRQRQSGRFLQVLRLDPGGAKPRLDGHDLQPQRRKSRRPEPQARIRPGCRSSPAVPRAAGRSIVLKRSARRRPVFRPAARPGRRIGGHRPGFRDQRGPAKRQEALRADAALSPPDPCWASDTPTIAATTTATARTTRAVPTRGTTRTFVKSRSNRSLSDWLLPSTLKPTAGCRSGTRERSDSA